MKKIVITLILILFMISTAPAQTAVQPSGSGTELAPYEIGSIGNLYWISQNSSSWSSYFEQTAHFNLNAYSDWPVIGDNGTLFTGHYDGQGFEIDNLTINKPLVANVGLFGHIGIGATVENVGLTNVDVIGARGTGSLVGRVTGDNTTLIENCYADQGTVVGDGATGGLVGSNNSYSAVENVRPSTSNDPSLKPTISQCYTDVDVSWSKSGRGDKIAGVSGCNQKGVIKNSYSRGSVTADNSEGILQDPPDDTNNERVGGVAGCTYLKGEIINCYSTCTISTANYNRVGAVVGLRDLSGGSWDGYVTSAYWDSDIESTDNGEGTGYTTLQMKEESNFTDWDFTSIWTIDEGGTVNDGYPYLSTFSDPPLPVGLSSFTVVYEAGKTLIEWETESEVNNLGFVLYRNGVILASYLTCADLRGCDFSSEHRSYRFTDTQVVNGKVYHYELSDVDRSGKEILRADAEVIIPVQNILVTENGTLSSAYPNPFNAMFTVPFELTAVQSVRIELYDMTGRSIMTVMDGDLGAGRYAFRVDAEALSSGLYFLRTSFGSAVHTQKLLLMK